jgi:hypothetical protein
LGRPTIWLPFSIPGVRPGYEYRRTDGAIRNGSHNILKDHFDGVHVWVTLESPHGNRTLWNKREVIARAHLGLPEWRCWVCSKAIDIDIHPVQANGDPLDHSPTNIVYDMDLEAARQHELGCLEALMSARPHGTPRPGIRLPRYGLAA